MYFMIDYENVNAGGCKGEFSFAINHGNVA